MEQARPDSTVLPAAQIEAGQDHDSSYNADERITRLLATRSSTPLPAPGSKEAKAAFKAACSEHSARTARLSDDPALARDGGLFWTRDRLGKALDSGELTPAEYARLYPLANERELLIETVAHELSLGSLFALAYADDYPLKLTDADALPEGTLATTLIAKHRAAYAAWEPHLDAIGVQKVNSPAFHAAEEAGEPARLAEGEAFADLIDARATTLSDLAALAAYLPEAFRLTGLSDPEDEAQRALFSMCSGVLSLMAAPTSVDPVFAAIDASHRAEAAMDACEREIKGDVTPEQRAWENECSATQCAAMRTALRTVPTTRAGRLALVDFTEFQAKLCYGDNWQATAQNDVFGEIAEALKAAIRAERAEVAPHPDAELIALAGEFWSAYVANSHAEAEMMAGRFTEAEWDPYDAAVRSLMNRLAIAEPKTVLGLALKRLAMGGSAAWELGTQDDPAQYDRNERVAAQVRDAAVAGTLAPIAAPAAETPLDLRDASVSQLARFHDHLLTLVHIATLACHAPMAVDDKSERSTVVGSLLEDELERLDRLSARVADEIRTRAPADADEHSDRLTTLTKYQMTLTPGIEDRALVAEINAAWGA